MRNLRIVPALAASLAAAFTYPTPTARAEADAAGGADAPADFAAEAKLLYRVVACGRDDALPPEIDPRAVETHCKWMRPRMERYRQAYGRDASAFIARQLPPDPPRTVVYPFGGGDLLSALTVYPNATEVTTMSLEHAGDPRRIHTLKPGVLDSSLQILRRTLIGLIEYDDSRTDNLMKGQRLEVPGQLSFFLVALAVHGYEPTGLKYFRVEPDGKLHYLTVADIAAAEKTNARLLHVGWVSPDFSEAFSHAELTFVKKDSASAADRAPRVHRHIAFNLDDKHLEAEPGLLRHLEAKGKISAMTKAASYLLWRDDFSKIREYLLQHMEVMVSDSTGIPPAIASKAGFEQVTYGQFVGSFLSANPGINRDFRQLWKSQPQRPLPFRWGYIDAGRHYHMLITRRPAPGSNPRAAPTGASSGPAPTAPTSPASPAAPASPAPQHPAPGQR